MTQRKNLNNLVKSQDESIINNGSEVIYFDNIEDRLIENIEKYPVVLGCVAWSTC
jgi:hypothetical protein